LEYLGRIDHQVKIRGFRIELGEIEAALGEHGAVEQVVVLMREDQPGDKRLVAYVVKADISEVSNKEEWREFLSERLPAYMVPAVFVELEKLPLTTNGKLDRHALPAPELASLELGQGYVAPRTLIEKTVAEIWLQVLGVDQVGVYDNFFELGGHSLLATRLVSKIRSQMNVDLPLKALFERGSVAQLAQLIEEAEKSDIPPIQPVDRAQFDRLPLSFAQERLWFINQLEPDSAVYNLPGAVTIRGELDINQLEQAFNLIIARHENLRTLFPSQDGQAQQLILDRVDFKLERVDLSHYEIREARDNKAKKICQTDAATPFDLAGGPLIRGKVIKLAVDEHILMLNMHHIISDGWSLGVLIKEIGLIMEAFREGRRPELPPLPIQYLDYSVWQRQWLEEGGTLARLLAYWRERLSGPPESLNLPADYPRPSVQSLTGATQAFSLDESLTARLKGLAEEQGCTLYMVLLAAFKALLHRYTGQTDICVGSSIANRQYGETEGLIGFFVNVLPLRTDLSGDPSFHELLGRVREVALGAYAHQDLPFGKLIEELHVQRSANINPLFQVVFVLQNTPVEEVRAPGLIITPVPVETGAAQFDLVLAMEERSEGLEGSLTYSADLFERATAERMIRHLRNLLEEVVKDPERRLPSLQLMAEEEVRAYSSEQFKSLNLSRKGLEDLILEIEEARSE
jgi:acyl carrier protein